MKRIGIGYASIFYGTGYGNGFPDESRATVEITPQGSFKVYVEVSDVGSGGISVMWQIAVETLGVIKEDVEIIYNNTALMHDSGTAAASRQTYNTGNAVLDACMKLKENIRIVTENIMETDLKVLYKLMISKDIPTRAEGYFKASTSSVNLETGQGDPYWPYTFGTERITVAVDDETGKVDILDVVAVFDAGKIVNPVLAQGQVEGGCAMGIGYGIMEAVDVVNGSIKNRNFSDYIIPTSKDVPQIKTIFIEECEKSGPYGAKGLGEPVMLPTAPAIMNAIYDAIGVRIYEMPATCEKILDALKNKNK